jgi:hypothetical protein
MIHASQHRHAAVRLYVDIETVRDLTDTLPAAPADREAIETMLGFLEGVALS